MKKGMIIGAATLVVAAAVGTTVYWNLPNTKVGRELKKATEYMTEMAYVQAEAAYEEALSIDDTNERAYRGLADDYLAQGRQAEAEAILKKGIEATGSEVLRQNYHATVLNAVVQELNAGEAGLATLERCLQVLEEAPDMQDAQTLLATCMDRVLAEDGVCRVMLDGLDGSSTFAQFAGLVERLFTLVQKDSASYLPLLKQCLLAQDVEIYLSLANKEAYYSMLQQAKELGLTEAAELMACLDQQEKISGFFAPMFAELEEGNFKAAKAFIVSEPYTAIRDAFIQNVTEYWVGGAYVPVTKEAIMLKNSGNGWKFSFVENDRLAKPTGTIRVLGEKMKDLGVQRSSMEYVPAYDPARYYPHTEYEIVYWNTMVDGIATDNTNVVSRMNYRFAEKIYNETGMDANMIYDWGGANETRKKE